MHKNMQDRWEREKMKTYLCSFLYSLTYCISSRKGFLDLSAIFKMEQHFLLVLSKFSASGRKTFTLGELLMRDQCNTLFWYAQKDKPAHYAHALQEYLRGKSLLYKIQKLNSQLRTYSIFQYFPLCPLKILQCLKALIEAEDSVT